MAARYPARVWLALLTIYIVWGSTFIAVAIIVRDLPPFLAMAIRHLVAGGLLLAWALPRGDRAGDPVGRAQILAGFVFGGLLFLLAHGSLAWAQQTVPAGVAALLVGSIPIWMALLDRLVFGKRLRSSAYLGFALGFVGLAFLIDPFGEGQVDRVGAVVIVLGALAWAAGSLYSRRAALPKRPLVAAGLGAVCGGILLLAVSIAGGELGEATWSARRSAASPTSSWSGAWSASRPTSGSCVQRPVSLVATYAYVNPIVAVALGALLLGETISFQMVVAGASIVVAVALILRASGAALEPGRGLLRRRTPVPAPLTEHTQ